MADFGSINGKLTAQGSVVLTEADGVVLTGQALTDVGIIGANPEARLWGDGSITGSSANGSFTKYANGELECTGSMTGSVEANTVSTTIGYSLFSATFISTPIVTYGLDGVYGNQIGYGAGYASAITHTRLIAVRGNSSTTNGAGTATVTYIAKGRWKI